MTDSPTAVKHEEQPDGQPCTVASTSDSTSAPVAVKTQATTNKTKTNHKPPPAEKPTPKPKPKSAPKPKPAKKIPVKSAPPAKKSTVKPKPKTEPTTSTSSLPTTIQPSLAQVANPLFGRTGSASIREEDVADLQLDTALLKSVHGQKGARSRKKLGPVNKVAELTKHLKTSLPKEDGVLVEVKMMCGDGSAVLNNGTWTQPLLLTSPLPFHLLTTTLHSSTHQIALLLHQATPFPLLSLPLHIRTLIYTLLLTPLTPTIPIASKSSGGRLTHAPSYSAPNKLALLRASKQIHAETAPLVYTHTFEFPGTGVASDFLLRLSSHRVYLTSLRCLTYSSQTARTLFHLLLQSPHLQRLSFAHVSSSETPRGAVKNLWRDAGMWLQSLDKEGGLEGLRVLGFDESAFHVRERVRGRGFKVTKWGEGEQIEFLVGLRAVMVSEGNRGRGEGKVEEKEEEEG